MFKKNSNSLTGPGAGKLLPWARAVHGRQGLSFLLAALLLAALTAACRTVPRLPKVDLAEPGWKLHQGQALWRANKDAPEISGEILLATNGPQRAFVQFTKTPFPFVIAQITPDSWQIESPTENRFFSGRGSPPSRVLWLQLPRAVAGARLPNNWSWHNTGGGWRLENLSNGESLEGYFTQ